MTSTPASTVRIEVPVGAATTRVELGDESGGAVLTVVGQPVSGTPDVDAWARRHGEGLAAALPGYADLGYTQHSIGTLAATDHRFEHTAVDPAPGSGHDAGANLDRSDESESSNPPEQLLSVIARYFVNDGVAYFATACTRAASPRDAAAHARTDQLIAAVDTATGAPTTPRARRTRRATFPRPPISKEEWGRLRASWDQAPTTESPADADGAGGVGYSVEELMVVGNVLGAVPPGAEESSLAGLDDAATTAVFGAAYRSLRARGALNADGTELRADVLAQFTTAIAPDLQVHIDVTQPTAPNGSYVLCLQPDQMVEVVTDPSSVAHYDEVPCSHLVHRVMALTSGDGETRAGPASDEGEAEMLPIGVFQAALRGDTDAIAGEPLRDAFGAGPRWIRVRTLFRDDRALVGGELVWMDAGPFGQWRCESKGATMQLTPFPPAARRAALLEQLPGADAGSASKGAR